MKTRMMGVGAALVLATALTGCSHSSSPYSSVPSCQQLVGKILTRAMANGNGCIVKGSIQMVATLQCKNGLEVAFGNSYGGFVGQPLRRGDFASNWPGCKM